MSGAALGELINEAALAAPARLAAQSVLRVEEAIQREAKQLQVAIREEIKEEPEVLKQVGLLESIPGVGFFSAVLLVLELWDISRFRDESHLASYIGFVPSTYQTGQSMYHGEMTRQGNVLVRWIIVQDAWAAVNNNGFFAARYEYYRAKKGGPRAIVPVARALLNTIFQVWTLRKTYSEIYGEKALVG